MHSISHASACIRRGTALSLLVLAGTLGVSVTAAHAAGTTTVQVISNVLRITDGNSFNHNLSINDDGANSVWVGDVTTGATTVVGAGCTAKTVSSVAGATCLKTGFMSLYVNYTGGDDLVFDNRTLGTAKPILAFLGSGADYFKSWVTGNNASEVHGGFGDDILIGNKQADKLYGDDNHDTLQGSQSAGAQGADILDGGTGDDDLFAKYGQTDITLQCGTGTADTANTDVSDSTIGCETVTH